jgi:hypothetical protein
MPRGGVDGSCGHNETRLRSRRACPRCQLNRRTWPLKRLTHIRLAAISWEVPRPVRDRGVCNLVNSVGQEITAPLWSFLWCADELVYGFSAVLVRTSPSSPIFAIQTGVSC